MKFSLSNAKTAQASPFFEDGIYSAVITQVADIGLQKAYNPENPPEEQMAVLFETEAGIHISKRMKFSAHPLSNCYATFTSAFPGCEDEKRLSDLLGQSVLIDIEVNEGKWPRITGIMPLEEGFNVIQATSELVAFDANEMDLDAFRKLHRDIRFLVSKRIRQPEVQEMAND